jgi:DNA-binding PadR family transcriptional regulator
MVSMKDEHFLNKDMRNTMLKVFILRRLKKSEANSYALMKEFMARRRFIGKLKVLSEVKNEIYNTIKSLEKSKYIKSSHRIENGRLKNYYTLTAEGKKVLESAKKIFQRNIKEISSLVK